MWIVPVPFSGSYSCHPALSSLYNTLDILLPRFALRAQDADEDDNDDNVNDDMNGDKGIFVHSVQIHICFFLVLII